LGGKHWKAKHEENPHEDVQEQRNPSAGSPEQKKEFSRQQVLAKWEE